MASVLIILNLVVTNASLVLSIVYYNQLEKSKDEDQTYSLGWSYFGISLFVLLLGICLWFTVDRNYLYDYLMIGCIGVILPAIVSIILLVCFITNTITPAIGIMNIIVSGLYVVSAALSSAREIHKRHRKAQKMEDSDSVDPWNPLPI